MYMVIMLYGMNIARSIIEEKTSRVFEVLLATIKPDELLAGKIIGVGAVGVTQVAVWMIAAAALASSSMVAHLAGTNGVHGVLSGAQIGFFVLYFIFGFLMYSAIAAALGAMTNSEQELQQLNMFLVLPLAFCMVMLFPTVESAGFHIGPGRLAHPVLLAAADELPHRAHQRSRVADHPLRRADVDHDR